MENCTVQDYNFGLAAMGLLDHTTMTIPFQNEALYKLCSKHLGIEAPTYKDVNQLMAQYLSTLTSSMRLPSKVATTFC